MIASFLTRFKESLISNILLLAGTALSLLAGILYLATGVTQFTPQLDTFTAVFPFVSFGIGLIAVLFGFKEVKYVAYISGLLAFLAFLRLEVSFIANVFIGIDRTSFTFAFILNFASLFLAMILFLVSGILQKDAGGKKASLSKEEQ